MPAHKFQHPQREHEKNASHKIISRKMSMKWRIWGSKNNETRTKISTTFKIDVKQMLQLLEHFQFGNSFEKCHFVGRIKAKNVVEN